VFCIRRVRYPDAMTTPDPIRLEPHRFALRLPRVLWIGVAAVSVLLLTSVLFVRSARRAARASYRASGFRHAIMDMQSFSDSRLMSDPDGGGPMSDVVAENGDRLLSWRVWLIDHSIPLPGDSRADYDKFWDHPRNLRTAAKGVYDFTKGFCNSTASGGDDFR